MSSSGSYNFSKPSLLGVWEPTEGGYHERTFNDDPPSECLGEAGAEVLARNHATATGKEWSCPQEIEFTLFLEVIYQRFKMKKPPKAGLSKLKTLFEKTPDKLKKNFRKLKYFGPKNCQTMDINFGQGVWHREGTISKLV